jgi:hypothetical protein
MTAAQLSQSDVASDPMNWIRMVALFLMLNIARGVSTWIMFPTLTRMGYGLNLKETIMLVYAGLRGGICIALVLLIRRSSVIDSHTLNEMGFYVAGAVMLTLMVNGTTIETVYRWLKIYPKRTWAQIQLQRALAQVEARESQYAESLKNHWFFKNLNLPLIRQLLPEFGKAEFNVETGEVHVPLESVSAVMKQVMDHYDMFGPGLDVRVKAGAKRRDDNGFMYSSLRISSDSKMEMNAQILDPVTLSDCTIRSETTCMEDLSWSDNTDRLVRVVQLSDTRIKAVGGNHASSSVEAVRNFAANMMGKGGARSNEVVLAGVFQCHRKLSDFVVKVTDESMNPFASFQSPSDVQRPSSSSVMEFSIFLPDVGIAKHLIGSAPRLVVGLSLWLSDSAPGKDESSCGLLTEEKSVSIGGQTVDYSSSDFKRELVRGDSITISAETGSDNELKVTFKCGRFVISECVMQGVEASQLHPTIAFLEPEEEAELSFALRTTTSAETRAESYAYILNAAICLYEDLFKGGTLSAQSLRVLCDSVQYGIDAANDDLEVRSLRTRVKTVKDIYKKGKSKYESMFDKSSGEEDDVDDSKLSPLETEWGFIQLRHLKRVDCNDPGFIGLLLRLGELIGIRYQYRQTYRKIEELLAYGAVHSDLISHVEMARFPETLQLVSRLVLTSKSYLMDEIRRSSPRDFYIAQHVLAAKILLSIRKKVLFEFIKAGSLGQHAVEELDEHYIKKQLLNLEDFTPSRPKASGWFSLALPKTQTGPSKPVVPTAVQLTSVVTVKRE